MLEYQEIPKMDAARRPVSGAETGSAGSSQAARVRSPKPTGSAGFEVLDCSLRAGIFPARRLSTHVAVGVDEGLKHESSVHCDELVSLPKSILTRFVGRLRPGKAAELDSALAAALDLESLF